VLISIIAGVVLVFIICVIVVVSGGLLEEACYGLA